MNALRQQICTFSVEGMTLGIDVTSVQEVIRHQAMTRVPSAPPGVKGLINLRGQIVTAIDLRQRLGLPLADSEHQAMNVVVRDDDSAVSFLVDRMGDVLEIEESAVEPPPATLARSLRNQLRGVVRLDRNLLLILDTAAVLEHDNLENEHNPNQGD